MYSINSFWTRFCITQLLDVQKYLNTTRYNGSDYKKPLHVGCAIMASTSGRQTLTIAFMVSEKESWLNIESLGTNGTLFKRCTIANEKDSLVHFCWNESLLINYLKYTWCPQQKIIWNFNKTRADLPFSKGLKHLYKWRCQRLHCRSAISCGFVKLIVRQTAIPRGTTACRHAFPCPSTSAAASSRSSINLMPW